jgi:hypothetical protein
MITYPAEMLPSPDDGESAEIIVLSERENALLEAMPFDIWTESEDGQICIDLAHRGLCKHQRINSTLGRFHR